MAPLPSPFYRAQRERRRVSGMHIHCDHRELAVVRFDDSSWTGSPQHGVERKLLERDGDEIARATSIVRYAAGSSFPRHVHDRGEEFLVLEGVFSDEDGDYSVGTYVRNPPGSQHAPFSRGGCTIFVKLRQFASDDDERVVSAPLDRWTCASMRLHAHAREYVELLRLEAPATVTREGGIEILVVAGDAEIEHDDAPRWTWWRTPARSVEVSPRGPALLWIKSGHLELP